MKKIIILFLSFIAFLFCSCAMSISNQEYIEIARGYLIENFGGEYTFVSLKKAASEDEAYVLFKSDNLDKQEVKVKIVISDKKIDSYTCHISSNYLNVLFENEETEYYKNIFNKYFTDCEVIINNSERFMDYYSVYWVADEITGEWLEREVTELSFEQYRNMLVQSMCKAQADIIVTEKNLSKYLDSEDKLKGALVDLDYSGLLLSGDFYIVNELGGDYKNNCTFKANIEVYKGQYDGYKYDYKVQKSE